jgi:hypothetical protein
MGAVVDVEALGLREAEVDLVDEGGGLQGMGRTLARHVAPRRAMELLVDERHELGERLVISEAPGLEKSGDFM